MSDNAKIFERLVEALQYRRRCLYTDGRKKRLGQRLKSFSDKELLLAARELTNNAYMMGDNPGTVRYATIDYLLRSDEIVERWLEMATDDLETDLSKLSF